MTKKRIRILLIILAAIVVFCVVTYTVTPLLILRPTFSEEAYEELTLIELEEMFAEKRAMNLPMVEDVTVNSPAGKLHGWRLHQASNSYTGSSKLLLYFGGYDEDSSASIHRFLQQMTTTDAFDGYDIAAVDWPEFGTSEGDLTDDAIRECALSIYQYFSLKEKIEEIYLMGFSFGTGPATYTASKTDAKGLILLAPYESAFDLYNSKTPVFYGPMRLLISFRMDAGEYAESVGVTPLVAASLSDRTIPFRYSETLCSHFPNPPLLLSLKDVAHGDLRTDPEVLDAIKQYLNRASE